MENNFENLPVGTVVEINGRYLAIITSLISSDYENYGESLGYTSSGYDYEAEPYPFSSMNIGPSINKIYKNYPKFKKYLTGIMIKDITKVVFLGYQKNKEGV